MTETDAIALLVNKANALNRLPKKSDFTPLEISKIKSKLGPWNRALERAGLKEISPLYLVKRAKILEKREKEVSNEKVN